MARLVIIVEGDGDKPAARELVRRILQKNYRDRYYDIDAISARGRYKLLKDGGFETFLGHAIRKDECVGILVLIDTEDEHQACPPGLAKSLSLRAKTVGLQIPLAIVCAVCEYESWFLASMHTIAGKYDIHPDAKFPGNPEEKCNAKKWIQDQMPKDKNYKETIHQVAMTFDLDLDHLSANVRSFQRLLHAVDELLTAINDGQIIITPQ